jgi:AraC-like DNA-binding protein
MARIDPHNRSNYWWDRQTVGLSLLRADFTTHEYPPHSHDAFVVAVTEDGGSVIKSRGTVEEALPSTLFVFNPAEPHAGWMGRSRRWRYRSLYLTRQAIDTVAEGLGIAEVPYFTRNLFTDVDLIADFLALHRCLELDRDSLEARQRLLASFGRLFARHGSGGRRIDRMPCDGTRLGRAIELMHARHAESLRLDDIAVAVGLTPFQLISLFRRATGLTPHTYLTQVRLAAACRLLRHGTPLADTAAAAGFYDQSALQKHFKRCYGITPLQFQRAALH